jgi:hypothetical protein
MKNQIFKIVLLSLAVFCFAGTVNADTSIHLSIKTATSTLYDADMTVAPCDSDNAGGMQITAYCAIRQSEIQNDWNWAWAPGAFLNSLGDISGYTSKDVDNNDVYHYWSWSLNGTEGATGLNQYELQTNDLISLDFIDPVEPTPPAPSSTGGSLFATTSPSPSPSSSSSVAPSPAPEPGTLPAPKPAFDLKNAFAFIASQQKENGSFGEDLYTDWTALALASGNNQDQTIKLIKYFGNSEMVNPSLTDLERRAMALMALGLNPYATNGKNYIENIVAEFDGKQFGDANEDNDDIFALIVLQNAGYTQADKIITDDLNFILSRQKDDGSWDNNIDMTGAAIEALASLNKMQPLPTLPLSGEEKIPNALAKAKEFLKQNQKDDGGWGNPSSTAWALEGVLALNEKPEDWVKNGNSPLDYLATLQDTDGGIKGENMQNKLWQTAYATSALSGKTWNQIMQKFEKPKIPAVKQSPKKFARTVLAKSNAVIEETPTEIPKNSWFKNFLDKIFGIF